MDFNVCCATSPFLGYSLVIATQSLESCHFTLFLYGIVLIVVATPSFLDCKIVVSVNRAVVPVTELYVVPA